MGITNYQVFQKALKERVSKLDYLETIIELNLERFDLDVNMYRTGKHFRYSTNGFDYTISFDVIEIWNSYEGGMDSKDFKDFKSFIRNKYHEKIKP